MKKCFAIFILLLPFVTLYPQSESFSSDSVVVKQSWHDKNGENTLEIQVSAVYNPYDGDASTCGYPTMIHAKLTNPHYSSNILHNDEDYQMEIIMFYEDAIWYRDIDGVKAVFIPFFYCCMDNTPTKVSYIIFYKKKKYLYHLGFLCNGLDPKGICVLQETDKDLNRKFRKMPKELRSIFIDYIENNYKRTKDVFPRDPESHNFQH